MKRLLAFSLGLLLVAGVAAQDEQKSPRMWLGGEVTFGSMSSMDFTLGPGFGFLISDRMGLGGSLLFSVERNAYKGGFEPFFRYYIPVAEQFSFYGDAFVGINGGDNNTEFDGGNYFTFSAGTRAGLQCWFTRRWSVAASTNIIKFSITDGNASFGGGVSFNSVVFALFFHF